MNRLGGIYSIGDWAKNKGDRLSDSLVDGKKAIHWYLTSASQGDKDAMRSLGEIYRDGQITPQNTVEAKRWYEAGARAGDRASLLALGYMAESVAKH